jgi:hypothetical protein
MSEVQDEREAVSLVRRDVVAGLDKLFPAREDDGEEGFRIAEDFAGQAPITNDAVEAVVWTWTGRDTVGFGGLKPTRTQVVVRGVTLIERGDGETGPRVYRYVDWSQVAAQLGVGFTGRPVIHRNRLRGDDPEPEPTVD